MADNTIAQAAMMIASTPGIDPAFAWGMLSAAKGRSHKPYSLTYAFDELRLHPHGGAALASGSARIAFNLSGEWEVEHILLDPTSSREIAVTIPLASPLGQLIGAALLAHDDEEITIRVDEEIDGSDRIEARHSGRAA